MKDSEDIQQLIRLKRYESPGDTYFESFLEEFKDRQRAELLHRSARGLLLERVSMWFNEMNGTKWLVPAGATAAVIAFGFYITRPELPQNGRPVANLTSSTTAAPEAGFLPPGTNTAGEDEVILLQLPPQDNRVPGLRERTFSGVNGLLPAGSQGSFREL